MELNWSFKARLHNTSDPLMKNRYFALLDELATYKGVKTSESWDKVRVYIGKVTYAEMTFRGNTLCLALALNPSDYVGTKYKFENIGNVARYAAIPMLVRLSSNRQFADLCELLQTLFKDVPRVEGEKIQDRKIPFYEEKELIEMGLIKVYSGKKGATEEVVEEPEEKPTPVEPIAEEPKKEKPASAPVKKQQPQEVKPAVKVELAVKGGVSTLPMLGEIPLCVKAGPKGAINLGTINDNFESGATVTPQKLIDKGLLNKNVRCLKVLAGGRIDKSMKIAACKFSRKAQKAIEAAGGSIAIIKIIK